MVRRTIALIGGVHRADPARARRARLPERARGERDRGLRRRTPRDLLRESKEEGDQLFELLQGEGGTDQTTSIINTLNGYRVESGSCVDRAEALDVPGDLSDAHGELLEVLELRRDGLADIADALRVALGDQDRREGTRRGRRADAGASSRAT